ncbi:MAG: phosphoenolpyruvate hydrolase family protein [Phycisphaeraceae bacterium]
MAYTREQVLQRLRGNIERGVPIVGGGAGNGISAKCQEAGGVDLLVIYNSGRFRMNGRGSLAGCMPYGDANAIVMDMAGDVLTIVENTPVLAGVCGTDPTRLMNVFLGQVQQAGFSGVQNFPTVGLCDGVFRANLEESGMGYEFEVRMIATAHKLGLFTSPYAFNVAEAQQMTHAGADVVVAHMGLTTKGSIGAHTARTLDDCVREVQAIADAARAVRDDVIVLCHGGPIAEPDDAQYVLQRTRHVHGFYGASSVERLPTEVAIKAQMQRFKAISFT